LDEVLIAPCGMDCALCINYLAMKYDLKNKGIHRSYCAGCLPRGKNCTFMNNACEKMGEGLVRFCYQCPDFPCRRLKNLDKRYRTKYHMSMIENLVYIRDRGMPAFLEKESAKWRCTSCGGNVSCHNGLCLNCDINKLLDNRRYRWGEETG
jgi:hypothetical protein